MWWDKKIVNDDNKIMQELRFDINGCIANIINNKKYLDELVSDFNIYKEENNNRIKKLNNLINEKLDYQKEENEGLIIGINKAFNQKIDNLSEGKPIVTDLLKRIAFLEGIKESNDNRRKTEDILHKLSVLNDYMLKSEREERDTVLVKEQIAILKWVLGEI